MVGFHLICRVAPTLKTVVLQLQALEQAFDPETMTPFTKCLTTDVLMDMSYLMCKPPNVSQLDQINAMRTSVQDDAILAQAVKWFTDNLPALPDVEDDDGDDSDGDDDQVDDAGDDDDNDDDDDDGEVKDETVDAVDDKEDSDDVAVAPVPVPVPVPMPIAHAANDAPGNNARLHPVSNTSEQ